MVKDVVTPFKHNIHDDRSDVCQGWKKVWRKWKIPFCILICVKRVFLLLMVEICKHNKFWVFCNIDCLGLNNLSLSRAFSCAFLMIIANNAIFRHLQVLLRTVKRLVLMRKKRNLKYIAIIWQKLWVQVYLIMFAIVYLFE